MFGHDEVVTDDDEAMMEIKVISTREVVLK
jgi:hypothetical protein